MSKQTTDSEKKSTTSKIFRWIMYVIMASIFILGTIIASVYITESRAKHQLDIIKQALNHLSSQENRISNLEKLPIEISNLNTSLNENIGSTNLLEENFKTLKEEVGNKKVELLSQQITNLNHRMDFVEETKNTESLILSIALLIKENILYGRNADTEINILSQMAKEQPEIQASIETLNSLKNATILTDNTLIEQYLNVIDNFDFNTTTDNQNNTENNDNAVTKSIKKIKETVSNINFDKVVVFKKDNKTEEQKILVSKLTGFINHHNFNKAIAFVNENPIFLEANNTAFSSWFSKLKEKVMFDEAVSTIVSYELKTIRENIENPKHETKDNSTTQEEVQETPSN